MFSEKIYAVIGPGLENIGESGREYIIPIMDMADKTTILLHQEETPEAFFRQLVFIQTGQNKNMEAGVPEKLESVIALRRFDKSIVGIKSFGIPLDHIGL